MEKQQVWDFLKRSKKVKFVKYPIFTFNLKSGSVKCNVGDNTTQQTIKAFKVEDFVEFYKVVESNDVIVTLDNIDSSMVDNITKPCEGENISLSFSQKTIRYFATSKENMAKELAAMRQSKKLLKKCMKDKNKNETSTGQTSRSVGIGGGYSITVNEPRNNY